ncbi:MAG: malonyl-CoA decarboxylase family protein [Lautropia sp.]
MFERFRQARKTVREKEDFGALIADCRQLLGARGESNSQVIAARALARFQNLSPDGLQQFFDVLADEFDPDPGTVLALAEQYAVARSPDSLIRLARAAEPPRQELLRRLNRAPGGTAIIVAMRERLLERLKTQKRLKAVDADFEHLLSSWFNPGFLTLARVDWNSPAALLERLIKHEAVHEIDGWSDLRRRLEPDRRCFVFFHPVLGDDPLIFVEVALVAEMPTAIAPLLDRSEPEPIDASKFKVAVFYSISNCQPGLRGINLGNFLIKRVAEQLEREFDSLKTFCTLSPIPGFANWLAKAAKAQAIDDDTAAPAKLARINQTLAALVERHGVDLAGLKATPLATDDEAALKALAAWFLVRGSHLPNADPVARFHLHNGARLERINAEADLSRKGVKQAHGMMVNYLYDLGQIEANHEAFVGGSVSASRAVMALV